MKIEESVVRDVLDLHSEFRSHPVARWAMTEVGAHPALAAPKGPHPGQRRVGTGSASLCTGDADPAPVNFMNRENSTRKPSICITSLGTV